MATLDDAIAGLTAEVTRQTTVTAGVVKTVNGLAQLLADALAAAKAAGATPAQLAQIAALQTTMAANDDAIAAAVVTGTPAA